MKQDRLMAMTTHGVALDAETWLIERGLLAPPVVAGSFAWLAPGPRFESIAVGKDEWLDTVETLLADDSVVLLTANGPYDLMVFAAERARARRDVFPLIYAALEAGRIYDLQRAQQLDAIAEGVLGRDPRTGGDLRSPSTNKPAGYSLEVVTDLVLGRVDAKANDTWRLRYRELDGIPLDQWPAIGAQEALDYMRDDAHNTAEDALAQVGHIPKVSTKHRWDPDREGRVCLDCGSTTMASVCMVRRPHQNLYQVADQVYAAYALHAGAVWGFKVDQASVDIIERYARAKQARLIKPFIAAGLYREDGSENRSLLKRRVAEAFGANEPCPHCKGVGTIEHYKTKTLRCGDCKGRCVPWKAGGKLKEPTVATCATCETTGRVRHPNQDTMVCAIYDENHEIAELTCDGTGLVLIDDVPRSKKEGIAFGKDVLHNSGDEFLEALGDLKEDQKVLDVYIPYLRRARSPIAGHREECPHRTDMKKDCDCPGPYRDIALTLQPNAILETGRVSYSGSVQQFPRKPGFVDTVTYEVEVPDDYILQPGEEIVAASETV